MKFTTVVRWLSRLPIILYRRDLGWILGSRFLLLTHIGRRTGMVRHVVLEVLYFEPISNRVVVMSAFGRGADWYRNLQLHPALTLTLGRHSMRPEHAELSEDEAVAVFAAYEQRCYPRTRRIEQAVATRMVGWRYDGTDESRRRLVRDLPLLEFWPADSIANGEAKTRSATV